MSLESAARVYNAAASFWESFEDRWQQWSRWSDTPKLRLDTRALALSRIFLSLALYLDWSEIWEHRVYWLTDEGVCPAARRQLGDNGVLNVNLFLAFESNLGITVILAATLAAVGCLCVGYQTRLSTFFLFIMSRSKQTRLGGCMTYGGDELETHLLFWCIFLPLNHSWSVDAWLENRESVLSSEMLLSAEGSLHSSSGLADGLEKEDKAHEIHPKAASATAVHSFSAPLLAYLLVAHVSVVYVDTGFWKNGRDWEQGLSVEQVLNLGHLANPLTGSIGLVLRQFPTLCWLLSIGTLYLERYGPFPFFIPTQVTRLATTIAFLGLHIGMHVCLQTGVFHYLSASAWMSGLPTMAMDKLEALLPPAARRIASETHKSPQPRKGFGLAAHLLICGVCLLLYVESVGWNCEALGDKICPWARRVKPHDSVRKAMVSIGLNDRWKMFAPNVTHRESWIDVMGAVEIGGKIHRVPLWQNGRPTFTEQDEGLWNDGKWLRPAQPTPPWEAHRWFKLTERDTTWDAHKAHWGLFMCKQWKKERPWQRLVGLWTIKSFRRVEIEVTYGELRYSLLGISWCYKDSEAIMKNLTKPDWLKKGFYGKAISWNERRGGATSDPAPAEAKLVSQQPIFLPTPLLILLPTAAFFLWLDRYRHSGIRKAVLSSNSFQRDHSPTHTRPHEV